MTPRLSRVWLLVALTSSCVTAFAQTPTTTPPPVVDASVRPAPPADEMVPPLKLNDAPLDLILPLVEQWTGRMILRPQALPPAQITINIGQSMTKAQALQALETLLNLNQIALVRMGDKFIKVVAVQNARGESPTLIEGSTLDLPPSNQVISKLFQLQFLRTAELGQMLGGLLSNISQPVVFDKNNSVLLTDTLSNIQRIEMLLEKLDQPMTANLAPKFYTVQFAKASDLVTKIRAMLQTMPQIGTSANYTPDDRTNQVILISDPRLHPFFDELISKLDVKSDPNTRNEVLYLKHADSTKVAPILNQLVSGQSKAAQSTGSVQPGMVVQPNQPAPAPNQPAAPMANPTIAAAVGDVGSTQFSSLVSIIADERSNALVVNGTLDDIRLIKELVDKIDILLAQVRIEVVITEVTLSDAASTGIGSLGLDVAGNKLIGFNGGASGLSVGASASSQGYWPFKEKPTAANPYVLSENIAARVGSMSLVGLLKISSTPRKNNATVLSNPSITTTHNKEAKFFAGSTRPVISSSTSSQAGSGSTPGYNTSSVTQQEIGITLVVKPLIGNDGSVQLDIKQSVTDSDPANDVEIDGNKQPIINKRETNSFITIKSGEIIVLGGIQKENKGHQTNRLGPIPWIGDFLGSRTRSMSRTELVVLIRPVVLTNTPADNEPAMKAIDAMPHKDSVRQKLDPNYVPPKTPFYKKHIDIP